MEKTILVTGANRGIGRECARALAALGHRVIVTARQAEAAARTAGELGRETNRPVASLQLDVTDPASISAAARHFGSGHRSLDVLINNAGIYPDGDASILTVDPSVLEAAWQTNTLGPLRVARAFRPWLALAESGGRIINLSSGLGQLHDMEASAPAYSISKTALNAVTRQLAAALGEEGIAVNSVCPGWVRTDMGGPNALRSVEEGADTVLWLALEAPPSLTGSFLRDREPIGW